MYPLRILRKSLRHFLKGNNLARTLLYICGTICLGGYTGFHLYFGPGYMVYTHKNIKGSCIIPQVNPFDAEIMKFFWKPDPIICSKDTDLVYFDYNSTLHINQSRTRSKDITCQYQEIIRKSGDDYNVYLGSKVWFNNSIVVRTDFVNVKCFHIGKIIYNRLHYQIYRPKEKINSKGHNRQQKYSILLFGLDSVSRLAAIRELPKTMTYLEQNLSAYILKGYTKLGDNTLPNMVPFLTGSYAFSKEFPVEDHKPFDNHSFLWRNISSSGGATMFLEDWPRISTFNLGTSGGSGFSKQPTNHYMRPFYLAINQMQLFESPVSDVLQFFEDKNMKLMSKSYLCYGDKPLHVIAIDYFKRFLKAYSNDHKFALVWNNKISHNYVNFIKLADDDLLDMLVFLKTEGFLENSFLFFLSDHGSRVDKIRNTPIGRLEERLPLLSVVVPEKLKRQFPNLHKNLRTNIDRLTSPFDIYETMVDIFNNHFQSPEVQYPYPRGISLFRSIPEDRSCANAGIDEHNCVCYSSEKVNVDAPIVQQLALFVVEYINKQLVGERCAKLDLKHVISAKRVHSQLSYDSQNQHKKPLLYFFYRPKDDIRERYFLLFDVNPSSGLFEVTVEHQQQKSFTVLGDISRTNMYGNQSACVSKTELRKFCYCV